MQNLDLIDWRMVGFAGLWVLALAWILAALSIADYHARLETRRMREVLRRPEYLGAIDGGLTLFCLGLIGSSHAWWETALWALLAAAFLAITLSSIRSARRRRD